jgi:hypothetical protein
MQSIPVGMIRAGALIPVGARPMHTAVPDNPGCSGDDQATAPDQVYVYRRDYNDKQSSVFKSFKPVYRGLANPVQSVFPCAYQQDVGDIYPNQSGLVGTVLLVLLVLDARIDLFPVNRNVLGRIHPDPDLIPFHTQHGDGDVVTDHQGFSNSSRKYQHLVNLLLSCFPVEFRATALLSITACRNGCDAGKRDILT